jgi:anti-sigma factor RsiW
MTCRELSELLFDFLAGELDAEMCQHIRAHLDACPPCVTYIETYQITVRLSRQLPAVEMPLELLKRLQEAVKKPL